MYAIRSYYGHRQEKEEADARRDGRTRQLGSRLPRRYGAVPQGAALFVLASLRRRAYASRKEYRRKQMTANVEGRCDPRFEAVKREFEKNFAERGEVV